MGGVWVDSTQNPLAVQHALDVAARESLLNHWGPLLSTEGSACVALCSCWLVAGYIHRAFHFDNSIQCTSTQVLTKTIQTWFTAALLLATCAIGTDMIIGQFFPLLQSWLCVSCHSAQNSGLIEGPLSYGSVLTYAQAAAEANTNGGDNASGSSAFTALSTLTQSDVLFIVDSLTVLIAWRWTANRILNSI